MSLGRMSFGVRLCASRKSGTVGGGWVWVNFCVHDSYCMHSGMGHVDFALDIQIYFNDVYKSKGPDET